MSTREIKTWLVAYDIRQPRRLRRVHRTLRSVGLAAQYSAFTVEADDSGLKRLLVHLAQLIDPNVDDVRAYHVPQHCRVWRLGAQHWPDGVVLAPALAARLVLETATETLADAAGAQAELDADVDVDVASPTPDAAHR